MLLISLVAKYFISKKKYYHGTFIDWVRDRKPIATVVLQRKKKPTFFETRV